MAFPVRDGVAVITGAAGGIGAALALRLASRGCHLALADIDGGALAGVASAARQGGVTVSEHAKNVADPAAADKLRDEVLARHRRANLLINNVGVALLGRFADITIADMSSIFGIVAPAAQTAYAASKFAVRGFSEALRHELEDTGVGVSVVHPGYVKTAIARNARVGVGMDPQQAADRIANFDRMTGNSPDEAAERIVKGIERREKRILIGSDAIRLDLLQRLFPVSYWAVMKWRNARAQPNPKG